ncbi:MAG: hypothetical protein M1822_006131 [Bathelium mastoideum]|nr:MAG: hypothetical protein M1822_006131 [Bathelium mastoideum]
MMEMLCEACKAFTWTFICIDALDECNDLKNLLSYFTGAQSRVPSIRLVCTSRPHIKFMLRACGLNPYESLVEARESDVRAFVEWRIEDDQKGKPNIMDSHLKEEIVRKLLNVYGGVFLLPVLHIDLILGEETRAARRHHLSSLESSLDKTFNAMMRRIQSSKKTEKNATRILTWIHLAERPLTVDELLSALAVDENDNDLNRDNFLDRDSFLDCCLGLAKIDNETSTVRLFHLHLYEYLTEQRKIFDHTLTKGHESLAHTCLTYLMFQSLTLQTNKPFDRVEVVIKSRLYPLLTYAARHWGHHLRKSDQEKGPAVELAHKYLSLDVWNRYWGQLFLCSSISEKIDWRPLFESFSNLHIIAYFGILAVLPSTLQVLTDLDLKDSEYGRSPLSWAAKNGHKAMVETLLGKDGVNPDSEDIHGRTPLWLAAWNGQDHVAELLLIKKGVNPNHKDKLGQTLLLRAAVNGNQALVKLLLAKDYINPNSRDDEGQTPLLSAAGKGYEAIVKLLLTRDNINPNSEDDKGQTPLSSAAGKGYEAIVKLLLTREDISVNQKNNKCQMPLSSAVKNGHEAIVKLLLTREDIDPNSKDNEGQTPLSSALGKGYEAIVKLLLTRADINMSEKALSNAAAEGQEAVVELLLARDDINVNEEDDKGQTPLSKAAANGHQVVVKLLLTRDDINVNEEDNEGQMPLSGAVANGHKAVVNLLLARDDINEKVLFTLLSAAAKRREAVIDLLFTRGDINMKWKALSSAVAEGCEAVVKLLLTRDDIDVNEKALLSAVVTGPGAMVKLLLARDDRIKSKALSIAAAKGHEAVARLLLARDNIKFINATEEVLSIAAEKGHGAIVKLLLAKAGGIKPNSQNTTRWTLLHRAVKNGHEAVFKELLAYSAVNLDRRTEEGWTLLTLAAASGLGAVVEQLLTKGVNPEHRATLDPDRNRILPLDLHVYRRAFPFAASDDPRCTIDADFIVHGTPLSFAANNGHVAIVKQLLSRGVDINHKARYRQKPLLFVNFEHQGFRSSAEKSVDVNDKDAVERTPLLLAAANGHKAVVQLLLEKGAELQGIKPESMFKSLGKDRQTPVSSATERGQTVIVKWLLEKSVKVTTNIEMDGPSGDSLQRMGVRPFLGCEMGWDIPSQIPIRTKLRWNIGLY